MIRQGLFSTTSLLLFISLVYISVIWIIFVWTFTYLCPFLHSWAAYLPVLFNPMLIQALLDQSYLSPYFSLYVIVNYLNLKSHHNTPVARQWLQCSSFNVATRCVSPPPMSFLTQRPVPSNMSIIDVRTGPETSIGTSSCR